MNDIFASVHATLGKANLPPEAMSKLSIARQATKQSGAQPAAISRVAMLGSDSGAAHILLFKGFQDSPRAVQDILDTYGEYILKSSGQAGIEIWNRKLTLADPSVAASFNIKLRSKQFSTFRSLVESFSGAVERLVALHYANALIHHRVSFGDAFNINVAEWPATADMANQRVPYSVAPLIGAYCDPDTWRSFPVAFRSRVCGSLACGRKDVHDEFVSVIDSVCESN